MSDYGVKDTGFVKKDIDVILTEIGDDEHNEIDETLDLSPTGPIGQLNAIFGDKVRELWDLAEATYRAHYPDSASGEALDSVCSITGTIRDKATKSQVVLRLFLDDGVTINAGSVVSVGVNGNRFVTKESVTNSSGVPATVEVDGESESTGPITGYSETIDTIQSPVSGWSAACAVTCANNGPFSLDGKSLKLKVNRGTEQTINFSGGDPWSASDVASEIENQTTDVDAYNVVNKVRVASLVEGTGSSIQITGGTANTILGFDTTEIKGFNELDVELGKVLETDPDLRLRRAELLRGLGTATVEAILAAIRDIEDVVTVFVFENVEELPNEDGIPPKSFEVVVEGGDDQEIADKLWMVKGAGIKTYGTQSEIVEDSQGFEQTVYFSRPYAVTIYISCVLTIDPEFYPVDGDDLVKQALVDYGDTLEIGEDVIALQFRAVPLNVPGVEDVPVFLIDKASPPVGTANIVIEYRQKAFFDTSNISVAS